MTNINLPPEQHSDNRKILIKSMDKEIDKGLASIKAGRFISGQDMYDEIIQRRKSRRK